MNTMHKGLLAAVAIALAGFSLPTPSKAASPALRIHFAGRFADAFFSDGSTTSGCVISDAAVYSASSAQAVTFVELDKYDSCTGTLLLFASGVTTTPAIQVSGTLDAATLPTTVFLTDYSSCPDFSCDGQPYGDVSVNLTWTATGPAAHSVSSYSTHPAPGSTITSHFNGTFRPATASGTISDGTTNFALLPLQYAEIGRVSTGFLDISHS